MNTLCPALCKKYLLKLCAYFLICVYDTIAAVKISKTNYRFQLKSTTVFEKTKASSKSA